ncbi:MAG: glutamate 5-kinase [Candidatus Altiarchaeota archaeon]
MAVVVDRHAILRDARLIVVKVGTSSVTDEKLLLSDRKVGKLVDELSSLMKRGYMFIIVSSGAIGAGMGELGLKARPRDVNKLQAIAAVGQNELMKIYGKHFRRHGINVGQILLTRDDFRDRMRYLNVRNTMQSLLEMGVIPIVNENDSIGVDEIRLGDNDTLSAFVASNMGAHLLVLLSSVDGVYTRDPHRRKGAVRISVVDKFGRKMDLIRGKSMGGGVGGIQSKINAARIATKSGIPVILANSSERNVVRRLLEGEELGTIFLSKSRMEGRLHWVLFSSSPKGCISVDSGAVRALTERNASLLPSGVTGVKGSFKKGDTICILDESGLEFARGITNYGSEDIELIKGMQTSDVEKALGKKSYKEIVYSGNMDLT